MTANAQIAPLRTRYIANTIGPEIIQCKTETGHTARRKVVAGGKHGIENAVQIQPTHVDEGVLDEVMVVVKKERSIDTRKVKQQARDERERHSNQGAISGANPRCDRDGISTEWSGSYKDLVRRAVSGAVGALRAAGTVVFLCPAHSVQYFRVGSTETTCTSVDRLTTNSAGPTSLCPSFQL